MIDLKRSLLFIPGNNPSMIQNATVFESDAVIFDLEDAVSSTEKDSARIIVSAFIESSFGFNKEIIVRINPDDTPYYLQDLNLIVSEKLDTIMLPKATEKTVKNLALKLDELEKKKQITKHIKIIPIIELAKSVLQIECIAPLPRVSGILLGAEDLSLDMGIIRTKEGDEISYVRSKLAVACKAYGIDAIDTPFTDVNDDEGLEEDTKRAKLFGLDAKSCIHPRQASIVNGVFSPSSFDIEYAKKVLLGYEEAQKVGLGVFSLEGKMIDKPIIERAMRIIAKAKQFGF